MILTVNNKEFELEQLKNIFGETNYEKHTVEELLTFSTKKLNNLIREKDIAVSTKWKEKGDKIVVLLWGTNSRCNHFNFKDNKVSLCSAYPSKNDEGKHNGRCSLRGGLNPSTSKRKPGGTPKDMTANNNSFKTGIHSLGKAKLPQGITDRKERLRELSDIERLRDRNITLIATAEYLEEEVGVENLTAFESRRFEEFNFTQELEDPQNPYGSKRETKETIIHNEKIIKYHEWLELQEQIRKNNETIAKMIKDMNESGNNGKSQPLVLMTFEEYENEQNTK